MKRLNPEESAELNKRIYKRALKGETAQQIGDALGISKTTAQRRIGVMVNAGKLPYVVDRRRRSRDHKLRSLARRAKEDRGVYLGKMHDLLLNLTDEQVQWLYEQSPKNSSVVDLIAAIVRDAYEEEHEQ